MIGAILFFFILHTILNQVNLACSFLGLRFVLFSKDVSVEGYNILADIDHGAQFDQKSSTPKESQSKTQLVSFQERFHFAVNDPIAATCSDLRNPSLPRSSFSPPSQSSNVYFDDSSMEMLWMQTTQEAYRHALCYMQPSMAHGDRSHVCPWSQEESARPECLLILAGQSTMASAMGSTWRTCANSETEVKATYSQEPTHPSRWTRWTWWTSTTSCTHDARSPTAWRGHGAHDPHESNDGVEHAAHEYDANTVPSGALCTALASTRDTLASLNTRSTSHHAAQFVHGVSDGTQFYYACHAQDAGHASLSGGGTGFDDPFETGGRGAATPHPESREEFGFEGGRQRWSKSHSRSSCSRHALGAYAQGVRERNFCEVSAPQQLAEVLVRCGQALAGLCGTVRRPGEKADGADFNDQDGLSGGEGRLSQGTDGCWGSFRRSQTKSWEK